MDLKTVIRDIPDFPKAGILFHDVTPIFKHPKAFADVVQFMMNDYRASGANTICAMDARGFIVGAALAHAVSAPLVLVRKKGKLPAAKISAQYDLEYGTAEIEMQDDLNAQSRVLLVDDLVATGGTLIAASSLIVKLGASLMGVTCIVDMPDLGGSQKLKALGYRFSAMTYYSGH